MAMPAKPLTAGSGGLRFATGEIRHTVCISTKKKGKENL